MEFDPNEPENLFVVKAVNVPREFFENRDVAKRYFRTFGKFKLVMFKPKRNLLLIEYTNEESMLNALEVAGEYKGHVFSVTRDTGDVMRRKVKPKKNKDPDWAPNAEIRDELAAMGGLAPPKAYNLRPEAMSVDPQEVPPPKVKAHNRKKGRKGKELISSEEVELTQVVRQQAFTAEDKYRILDARDKLIRIKMKKSVKNPGSKATVGTCSDMCPEKERLMREVQHQVALYEQEEGGKYMNQKLAVKQYSRSSADQEMPLPQELRPVGVLQMTMGYLMHKIMGLCDSPDVNLAEWYHFLWDRTRGIRKDITQQELCCQGSVELVEQCARFHIFCSARLVAEDASVFDQKINTENLTKCLQTLKYMYHDLQVKGISCINEAEFRAYIILLNLNDGNFMWEVQQLKQSIQESIEVRFALQVYSSLDKQNYVKFFKLVSSTTFLNACILMRYFVQVRLTAVKTFLKSYSPRVLQTSLPIHYLSRILGFENEETTIDFFQTYGLYTDEERSRLILDKPSFTLPEYPYTLDRAIGLVESKRHQSIGETVCGRELPPKLYETHQLQNSFDDFGYLKFALETDEVDSKPIKIPENNDVMEVALPSIPAPPPKPLFSVQTSTQAPPPKPLFPIPMSFPVPPPKPLIDVNIFAKRPPTPLFNQFHWRKPSNENLVKKEVVQPEKPKIDEAKLAEERRLVEEEKRKREEEERRVKEEHERRMRLEREREEERLQREREEKRRLEELRLAALKRMEEERRRDLEVKEGVKEVIEGLLDVVEENVRRGMLEKIRRRICERKLREVLRKWREITRRRRKRKALDFNPFWLGQNSVSDEAREFKMKSETLTLERMKRYKSGVACELDIDEDDDSARIDLSELTYNLLRRKSLEVDAKLHKELFWKVIISLPNIQEYPVGLNHIEKILDSYIKWERRGNTFVKIEQSKTLPTVTYCLEKQMGCFVGHKTDTNGFIFVANDFNEHLSKRIVQKFSNFGFYVKVPVVLVLQTYNKEKPYLKKLIKDGIITDYLILVDKFTPKNLTNIIEEALIFLATRAEKIPPLELDTLQSFLSKYLVSHIWKRASSFAKWNSNYKYCLRNPVTVIYLYNEALARLKNIILDADNREYARFPDNFREFLKSEIPNSLPCDYKYFPFFWDHPEYFRHLERILSKLRFPNFLENWPPVNQAQLEASISRYCSLIMKDSLKCFYKVMSVIMKNIDPDANFKDVENVVWSEVIEVMITQKLEDFDFSLYGTGFVNKSIFNQLVVVYDVDRLNDYVKSDWFYIKDPVVKQTVMQCWQEREDEVRPVVRRHEVEVDLDKIWAKMQEAPSLDAAKIKNEVLNCRKMLGDLEDTVVIHRRILERSGSMLKSIIEED